MQQQLSPLIQPDDLVALHGKKELVLVDVRTGPNAYERYKEHHLEKAQYVDLDRQLAHVKPDPADGGRHPLPDVARFAEVVQQLGIISRSHVVVYDDKNAANAASRFWWMLVINRCRC